MPVVGPVSRRSEPKEGEQGREHIEVSLANHIFDYRGVKRRCMRAVDPVSGRKESKEENTLNFRLPTTFLITGVSSADVCLFLIP
jgi:hypothetical protein